MVVIPPKPPTKTSHNTTTNGQGCRTRPTPPHHLRHRQQPHPLKHPISPRFHRGGLHFEQALGRFTTIDPSTGTRLWPFQATTGGFATIDPRHAGDTPQGSAYGSNSPQATNKDDPSHNDTRDIPPDTTPPATTANPSHHTGMQPRNHATTRRWNTARV